jgi:hypothetical protein
MANAVKFSQVILASIIKPLWDRFAQQASGFNDWIRFNIDLFESELPTPASSLQISRGKMVAINPNAAVAVNNDSELTVSWPTNLPDSLSLATDLAYLVAVNEANGEIFTAAAEVARSVGGVSIYFGNLFVTGDGISIYLAFRRVDGTVVSNTGYLFKTVTAS